MSELILGRGGKKGDPKEEEPEQDTAVAGVTCPLKSVAQAFPSPGKFPGQIDVQTFTAPSNCRTDCALYRGSKDAGKPGECWLKAAAKALAKGA